MKFADLPVGTKFVYSTDAEKDNCSYDYLTKLSNYTFLYTPGNIEFSWNPWWSYDVYLILEWEDECTTL